MGPFKIVSWIFAALLATLDTIIILASFDLTLPSDAMAWIITIVLVIVFYFIYRGQDIHGILVFSVFIFIFGYLALGPYSGVIRPVMDQAVESLGIARYAITNAFTDVWLLATNPTEWYARQQMMNVRPETPMSYPMALEITRLDASSPTIPADEEFRITAVIENEGKSDTRDVKISYECNKWCNADAVTVTPEVYKEEGETLEPGRTDVIRMSGFVGIGLEDYRAESHTAKVEISLNYSYSTNASLLVEVASEKEIETREYAGGEVYHNVLAIDKGTPARLSLNVGPQPLHAMEEADVLISVSNGRNDGKVILEEGKKIIIKMDETIGTLLECHGKQVDCAPIQKNIAICTVSPVEDTKIVIEAYKFNTILPIFCTFATKNVEYSKTGLITAELPSYTFALEKAVSVTVTAPLGIIKPEEGGEETIQKAPALCVKIDPGDLDGFEVWEFHLTNDNKYERFSADFTEKVEDKGLCTVFAINEEGGQVDERAIWKIRPGGIIKKAEGKRLCSGIFTGCGSTKDFIEDVRDVNNKPNGKNKASPYPGYDESVGGAYYTYESCRDKCEGEKCNLLENIGNEFFWKPRYELLCNNEGQWIVCDDNAADQIIEAGGVDHICNDGNEWIACDGSVDELTIEEKSYRCVENKWLLECEEACKLIDKYKTGGGKCATSKPENECIMIEEETGGGLAAVEYADSELEEAHCIEGGNYGCWCYRLNKCYQYIMGCEHGECVD